MIARNPRYDANHIGSETLPDLNLRGMIHTLRSWADALEQPVDLDHAAMLAQLLPMHADLLLKHPDFARRFSTRCPTVNASKSVRVMANFLLCLTKAEDREQRDVSEHHAANRKPSQDHSHR